MLTIEDKLERASKRGEKFITASDGRKLHWFHDGTSVLIRVEEADGSLELLTAYQDDGDDGFGVLAQVIEDCEEHLGNNEYLQKVMVEGEATESERNT